MSIAFTCGCASACAMSWIGLHGTFAASRRAVHSAVVRRRQSGSSSATSAGRLRERSVGVR
jgi:hypothetical protein